MSKQPAFLEHIIGATLLQVERTPSIKAFKKDNDRLAMPCD